ncbi:hypothetical protein SGRIM128S_09237 [Streptomyces griseomycini]
MLDLALAHQVGHGADGLLDRHVHVAPVHVAVEVDDVGLQPPQTRLDGLAEVRRVVAHDPPGRVRSSGIDRANLVATTTSSRWALKQRDRLVLARAVRVGRVVERDAQLQRPLQGRPRRVGVRRPVGEAHPHAAQALDAHLRAAVAEPGGGHAAVGHRCPPCHGHVRRPRRSRSCGRARRRCPGVRRSASARRAGWTPAAPAGRGRCPRRPAPSRRTAPCRRPACRSSAACRRSRASPGRGCCGAALSGVRAVDVGHQADPLVPAQRVGRPGR